MHNRNWLKSILAALFTMSMMLGFVPDAWSTVTVTLIRPAAGTIVQNSIEVQASASAAQGYSVSKVEFFDGSALIGTAISAPYSVFWSNATSGSHTLTAKATAVKKNSANQTATSAPVTVTFNKAPVATLTSPTDGAIFGAPASITVSATASDSDGTIAKVDFTWFDSNGNSGLIASVTQPPYTAVWTGVQPSTNTPENGSNSIASYMISAAAIDNQGGGGYSQVTVTVGPTVTITNPGNGATFAAPATIALAATVSSIEGISTTNVAFYNGTTLIGNGSPFSWQNVGAGTYALTAKALESDGTVWTSAPVNLTVTAASASAMYFIHPDHLNTPRLITNQAQQAVWRWDHAEPFGTYPANENPSGLGAFEFNQRFPGQYFDKETNTHYNMARDYDPSIGRYMESDPIGLDGGINTYVYVKGNPLTYIDPDGLEVRIMCRPLRGFAGVFTAKYYKHCFTYVSCPEEGWARTFSLFGADVGTLFPDYGYKLEGQYDTEKRDIPNAVGTSSHLVEPNVCTGSCKFEKAVVNRFISFPSGPVPYSTLGPNSNSFTNSLTTGTPLGGQMPAGVPGLSQAPGINMSFPGFPR